MYDRNTRVSLISSKPCCITNTHFYLALYFVILTESLSRVIFLLKMRNSVIYTLKNYILLRHRLSMGPHLVYFLLHKPYYTSKSVADACACTRKKSSKIILKIKTQEIFMIWSSPLEQLCVYIDDYCSHFWSSSFDSRDLLLIMQTRDFFLLTKLSESRIFLLKNKIWGKFCDFLIS